jgi:hypothetical protein
MWGVKKSQSGFEFAGVDKLLDLLERNEGGK